MQYSEPFHRWGFRYAWRRPREDTGRGGRLRPWQDGWEGFPFTASRENDPMTSWIWASGSRTVG